MDAQSENTPKNDLQSAAFELSKMSISIFHRSGIGATFAWFTWFSYEVSVFENVSLPRNRNISEMNFST